MELCSPKNKFFFTFYLKKLFLYFGKLNFSKQILVFQEMELKTIFLIFKEGTCKAQKTKKINSLYLLYKFVIFFQKKFFSTLSNDC